METLAGVFLGFVLGLIPMVLDRHGRTKAHFGALRSEISICTSFARSYLQDNVQAPLYRLPVEAYGASLIALLSDGSLNEAEATALSEYYALAAQFNRGLDNADHFHKAENRLLLGGEYNRNREKAEQLVATNPASKLSAVTKVLVARL